MTNQEILIQLSELEQEMKQLEERLALIDQQIMEMQALDLNLDEIDKGREKQILAGLGKGIFIKADLDDEDKKEKKLLVDVGSNVLIKKNIAETKEIIKEQIKKMFDFKQKLIAEIERIKQQAQNIISKQEKTKK